MDKVEYKSKEINCMLFEGVLRLGNNDYCNIVKLTVCYSVMHAHCHLSDMHLCTAQIHQMHSHYGEHTSCTQHAHFHGLEQIYSSQLICNEHRNLEMHQKLVQM